MPKRSKGGKAPKGGNTCRWCGKPLDSGKHRNITESYCYHKNEVAIRSRNRPRVKRIGEVYDEGRIRSEFVGTDMEAKLLKRQQQLATDAALFELEGYRSPRNVTHMSEQGFVNCQITFQRPFGVIVLGKVRSDGSRKRMMVKTNNLWDAVKAHRTLSKKYRHVFIVSRNRAYDLPQQWRFKKTGLSRKFVWCPYCADFRIYKRVPDTRKIHAMKKVEVWHDKRKQYEFAWKEVTLALTACIVCGNTNRDPIYRRANQPWELRHLNPKRRTARPRKGLPAQYTRKQMQKKKVKR